MFVIDVSTDPATHRACSRIANRLVSLIRPLLRNVDDRNLALREAYAIARDELENRVTVEADGQDGGQETARADAAG